MKLTEAVPMYTQEQFDSLPEWMQKDLVKDGDVYKHAGFLKVKKTADSNDEEKRKIAEELAQYKAAEATRKAEAEREGYERAKKDGNVEELEKRFMQQIDDAKRRADESEKQFKERMAKLAQKEQRALAVQIAAKYAIDEDSQDLLVDALMRQIQVDVESDTTVFLDATGSALSVDRTGFEAEFLKTPRYQRLLKADVTTTGGGKTNGNNRDSASKKPEEYTEQERVALYKQNPTLFNQLFPKK
jgi:hypothetical protein